MTDEPVSELSESSSPGQPAPHPTEVARLRLDRAATLCDQFEREARAFVAERPFRTQVEHDPAGGHILSRVKIQRYPPVEFSQIVGDCIHNLRASLDNLVWGFACKHQGEPDKPWRVNFPIYDQKESQGLKNERCWDVQGVKAITGVVAPEVAAVIGSLQPCVNFPDDPHSDLIWVLNRLWNEDKHQSPALLFGAAKLERLTVQGLQTVNTELSEPYFTPGPFEDGAVLAGVDYDPAGQVGGTFEFLFRIFLTFRLDGPAQGEPVLDFLRRMHRHLSQQVLPAFEKL